MQQIKILLLFMTLFLSACSGLSASGNKSSGPSGDAASPILDEIKTATPIPVGSWETVVEGVVYDNSVGPDRPIKGATIHYIVLHSYYMELQQGRNNKSETNERGEFFLPVMVHDTDRIRVLVEAQGFISYEEELVGVDLFGGKLYSIGLTPIVVITDSSP